MKTATVIQWITAILILLLAISCSTELPTNNNLVNPKPEISSFHIGDQKNMEDVTIEGANFNQIPQNNIVVIRNDKYGIYG